MFYQNGKFDMHGQVFASAVFFKTGTSCIVLTMQDSTNKGSIIDQTLKSGFLVAPIARQQDV